MIVIILGMHRSGTSALAGMLHSNGIVMGRENEFYPPPMKENPKGFFENRRFRTINDALLRNYQYSVKSFDPHVPTVLTEEGFERDEMKRLIMGYYKEYKNWGWKDPRTCLTLFVWLDVLYEMDLLNTLKILHIFRPYADVANSMKIRGNKEKYAYQFESLAAIYNSVAMKYMWTFEKKVQCMTLHFNDLITNTEQTIGKINGFLGGDFIKDNSFIDPAIPKNVDGEFVRRRSEKHELLRTNPGANSI